MPPTPPTPRSKPQPRSNPSLPTSALVPSRKSDRRRKTRALHDSAPGLKVAPASAGGTHKLWTESEEVALLKAAARFRARTGSAPGTPDMGEFFESVKGSLGPGVHQGRVFYKLKRLKSKFLQTNGALCVSGPHERLVYKLSAEVWGSEASAKPGREVERESDSEKGEEMGDASVNCAFVVAALREHWRGNERAFSGVLLEEGLRSVDPVRAMMLEMKWREQVEAEMQLKLKRHEMLKEVYSLLAQTVKGFGP